MGEFPCLNCPDRSPGCWSSCERYIAVKAEREKIKAAEKRESEARGMLNDYERDNIRRSKNR